jgi:hypothetical protein
MADDWGDVSSQWPLCFDLFMLLTNSLFLSLQDSTTSNTGGFGGGGFGASSAGSVENKMRGFGRGRAQSSEYGEVMVSWVAMLCCFVYPAVSPAVNTPLWCCGFHPLCHVLL